MRERFGVVHVHVALKIFVLDAFGMKIPFVGACQN